MNKRELEDRVESRLQLALTISFFYPAVLYSFFKFAGEQEISSNNIFLKATTLVLVYLISYLFFAVGKKCMQHKWLNWLDILILLGIASFIGPMLFATYEQSVLTPILQYLLLISLSIQAGMTAVICAFIVVFCTFGKNWK